MTFLAIWIGVGGAYLLIWAFNIRRLATAQRPRFSETVWFRWGIPAIGLLLLLIGFGWTILRSLPIGILGLGAVLGLGVLLIFHDRYTATIKILYADHQRLKRENPGATGF